MKKIVSLLVALTLCLTTFGAVIAAEFKFTDVKTTDWFYNDVKNAVEMGLINGKSETSYAPNDNLTYAEAIKLAACMNQLYNDGVVTLTSGNPWYKPYVDYCMDNKIIDKEYNYTDNATRAGYMGIFAKALPDSGLKAINSVPDNSIPDVPSDRAYSAGVYKLYRAGILTGVDEAHNCNPLANIKRSEVAAILTRMMNETKRVKFSMGSTGSSGSVSSGGSSGGGGSSSSKKPEPEELEELTIVTQPVAVDAYVGETASLTVEVEGGKAPYTYQWKKTVTITKSVTSDFVDEEGKIEGATTDTLKLTFANAGGYEAVFCEITDADGETVKTESVKVHFNEKSSGGAKDKFQQGESEELKNEDFLMYVEEVYTITGRGVVVTGRVINGKVDNGDAIMIVAADGTKKEATVAGIEMFKKMIDTAEKGDNIGLLLNAEIDKTMVKRGDSIISVDSACIVTDTIKGTLTLMTKEEGGRATAISEGHSPQFYRYGHDVTGKITGLTDGTISPGETQKDITVTFPSFKGVFYVGQELSVREGGRTYGTFTITSLSSGGREVLPSGKNEYMDDETSGGRVSIPSGKSEYMDEETSGGRVSIPSGKSEYME